MSVDIDVPPMGAPEARPTPSRRRPRVFSPVLSPTGLVVGAFFFALSVLPSLLPRAGYVQGIASGVTVMIGYGIGAGGQSLWDYLGIPKLKGRARTIVLGVLIVLVAWAAVFSAWRQVGWQNEIRTLFGMESGVVDRVARHHRRRCGHRRPAAGRRAVAAAAVRDGVRVAGSHGSRVGWRSCWASAGCCCCSGC